MLQHGDETHFEEPQEDLSRRIEQRLSAVERVVVAFDRWGGTQSGGGGHRPGKRGEASSRGR